MNIPSCHLKFGLSSSWLVTSAGPLVELQVTRPAVGIGVSAGTLAGQRVLDEPLLPPL